MGALPRARAKLRGVGPSPPESSGASASSSSTSLRRALDPVFRGQVAGLPVGPWELEEELARGAVGAVFRARRQGGLGPSVALKVLLAGEQASDTQRRRLAREAQALSRLDHPHVVKIHDAGESEGFPWIAMELVEGTTLEAHRPRDLRERVRILAQAARGLEQAHARGIVHRDVKPSNVMIRSDGSAVVTDFGLVRTADAGALTRSGALLGTPGYLSPEQALGQEATPASDVFALGVVLYEQLTGGLPWQGESLVELLNQLTRCRPTPPRELAPVPPGLEAICLRALAREPAARFPHAGALAEALEGWLRGAEGQPRGGLSAAALPAGGLLFLGALLLAWLLASRAAPPAPPSKPRPLVTPDGPQRVRLQPGPVVGKDATVRCDGLYANDNGGPLATLRIGDRTDQPGDLRALIELPLGFLPPGARVRRARLGLWLEKSGSFDQRPLRLLAQRLVASPDGRTPWVEGTGHFDRHLDGVCWQGDLPERRGDDRISSGRPELTQPDADPTPVDAIDVDPTPDRWVELDVTAAVRAWVAGAPALGLRLAHEPEGAPQGDGTWLFASSDSPRPERRPWLEVEWDGAPPGPLPDEAALEAAALETAERLLESAADRSAAEAAPLLDQAARAAPHLGKVYLERARVLAALGEQGHAEQDALRARGVALPPDPAEVDLLLGRLRLAAGGHELALEHLERARRALPLDPRPPAWTAAALLAAGRAEDALRARAAGSGRADLPWPGRLAAGQALLRLGRPQAAEAELRAAVEVEPRSPRWERSAEPALALAAFLRQQDQLPEARAVLRRARAELLDPRLDQALEALGR